jgi:hypothetical protein
MSASKISYRLLETGSEGYVRSVRLGEALVSKFLVMTMGENLLWPIQSVKNPPKNTIRSCLGEHMLLEGRNKSWYSQIHEQQEDRLSVADNQCQIFQRNSR